MNICLFVCFSWIVSYEEDAFQNIVSAKTNQKVLKSSEKLAKKKRIFTLLKNFALEKDIALANAIVTIFFDKFLQPVGSNVMCASNKTGKSL